MTRLFLGVGRLRALWQRLWNWLNGQPLWASYLGAGLRLVLAAVTGQPMVIVALGPALISVASALLLLLHTDTQLPWAGPAVQRWLRRLAWAGLGLANGGYWALAGIGAATEE